MALVIEEPCTRLLVFSVNQRARVLRAQRFRKAREVRVARSGKLRGAEGG